MARSSSFSTEWRYRTDLYEELGLEPAKTWDEFTANAKAVSESGKAMAPCSAGAPTAPAGG